MTKRSEMVRAIVADYRRTVGQTGLSVPDPRVLKALERVPRDRFVSLGQRPWAWANQALPIACDQTISQPYIVALMTDLLRIDPGKKVLEIGSGSGYQTAVLLELGAEVWAIELHDELARAATERLAGLGYVGFTIRTGDGREGWAERAPFDRILVAAVTDRTPTALLEQLAPGGRMVIPLEGGSAGQILTLVTKHADDSVTTRGLLPVRFVPLLHRPPEQA